MLSSELHLMLILKCGLCLATMKILIIKTSNAIRVESMSFESGTNMFQKKAKVTHETKRYEITADFGIKDLSLDHRDSRL